MMDAPTKHREGEYVGGMGDRSNVAAMMDALTNPRKEEYV